MPRVIRRRPRLLLGAVAAILLVLVVTFGLAARTAVVAAEDVEQARELVASAETLAESERVTALADAGRLLRRAERRLSGPVVDVVAGWPLLGRSWVAERRIVAASVATLDGVQAAVRRAPQLRSGPGAVALPALAGLTSELTQSSTEASAALLELRETRVGWTPAKVRRAVQDADEALSPVVHGLVDAARGGAVAGGLLGADGPRRLLVALENNAELRGTGGYVSTFATGVLRNGSLELQPFQDVEAVSEPPARARRVAAPAEFVEDYGPFLADTTLWRNWNMSPDVPTSASVGARVAEVLLGYAPDVVLLLDIPALESIVRLAGDEVVLDGNTVISPDELTEALLVDTYARAGPRTDDQRVRRAQLRSAATLAIRRLLADDVSPVDAARTLGELAAGRHLALWSARPPEQAELTRLGVAGEVDPAGTDLALVSVNNFGANKLDYYVDRTVTVDVTLERDVAHVVQIVELANQAPSGLVPYVAGKRKPGTLMERVELSASAAAVVRSVTVDGAPATGNVRRGRTRTRVDTYVEVPRGRTARIAMRYDVPVVDGDYRLHLLPQPLVRDAELVLRVRPDPGERLGTVTGAARGPDGVVDETASWSRDRVVAVRLAGAVSRTSRWERVRKRISDFWGSPVPLPR